MDTLTNTLFHTLTHTFSFSFWEVMLILFPTSFTIPTMWAETIITVLFSIKYKNKCKLTSHQKRIKSLIVKYDPGFMNLSKFCFYLIEYGPLVSWKIQKLFRRNCRLKYVWYVYLFKLRVVEQCIPLYFDKRRVKIQIKYSLWKIVWNE